MDIEIRSPLLQLLNVRELSLAVCFLVDMEHVELFLDTFFHGTPRYVHV